MLVSWLAETVPTASMLATHSSKSYTHESNVWKTILCVYQFRLLECRWREYGTKANTGEYEADEGRPREVQEGGKGEMGKRHSHHKFHPDSGAGAASRRSHFV